MRNTNTGGQAFPCLERGGNGLELIDGGMTLRDHFAAKAPEPPASWRGGDRSLPDLIAWRWWYADAMLKARGR